jgi:hypothetical protein
MSEKPIFELIDHQGQHIKIYGNGRVEGFNGTVINNFPWAVSEILEASSQALELFAKEIRNIKIEI